MKTKLITLLKTSFASKGFSQKTLEGIADNIIASHNLTEQSTDEDFTAGIEAVKPYADLMQSEISRQVNDQKPKPAEPAKTDEPAKPATPVTTDDMPEWAKALVTSTQALAQGLQAIQSEKVGNSRREQFTKTLEGTSDAYKSKALKDFDRLSFKDDEDFTSWLGETSEDVKVFIQDETNQNLGGDRPAGGFGGVVRKKEEMSSDMKTFLADREAEKPKV